MSSTGPTRLDSAVRAKEYEVLSEQEKVDAGKFFLNLDVKQGRGRAKMRGGRRYRSPVGSF